LGNVVQPPSKEKETQGEGTFGSGTSSIKEKLQGELTWEENEERGGNLWEKRTKINNEAVMIYEFSFNLLTALCGIDGREHKSGDRSLLTMEERLMLAKKAIPYRLKKSTEASGRCAEQKHRYQHRKTTD